MPLNAGSHHSVESILPKYEQDEPVKESEADSYPYPQTPDEYQLISEQTEPQQNSASPYRNPLMYRATPSQTPPHENTDDQTESQPTTSEKLKPAFWEEVYSRIDHEKIITGLIEAGMVENPSDPQDRLNHERHFEALLEFASSAKALANSGKYKMDNDTFTRHFLTVTNPQFDLRMLERRGYLVPPEAAKPPEDDPIAQDLLVGKLQTHLESISDSHELYKQIKRTVWRNRSDSWPPYLSTLNQYLLEDDAIDDLDIPTLTRLINTLPGIQQHLIDIDALPDLKKEKEEASKIREYVKKAEDQDPTYDITIETSENGAKPLINEVTIDNILGQTIPSYFVDTHLNSITFTQEQPTEGSERRITSRIAATVDSNGKPSTYDMTINGGWTAEKSDQSKKHEEEQIRSVYNRLTYQAAHIIVEQLPLPELMTWFRLYEREVDSNPEAQKVVNKAKMERRSPQIETFATIYWEFIVDPDSAESKFPGSTKFIATLIENYSSDNQLKFMLETRRKRRRTTKK